MANQKRRRDPVSNHEGVIVSLMLIFNHVAFGAFLRGRQVRG
jgi:hypothetical protein